VVENGVSFVDWLWFTGRSFDMAATENCFEYSI